MQNKKYRLKLVKISLLFLLVGMLLVSCKKDEDDYTPVPPRDRGVQQIADSIAIIDYLKTHYYDSSITYKTITDVVIGELEENQTEPPLGNTLLKDAVDSLLVSYSGVEYKIYYLNFRVDLLEVEKGKSPTFADNVLVNYEGKTLDDKVFDSAVTPVSIDLANSILGWSMIFPYFNTAKENPDDVDGDGVFTYTNPGVGLIFIPSGLAYFSQSQSGIAPYSPLIFKFELLEFTENDHDGDGIPSYLEDLNGDGIFNLASDDTDGDGKPNFSDSDDDGDGVLTEYEIEKDPKGRVFIDENGIPIYIITSNGKPKHLDSKE